MFHKDRFRYSLLQKYPHASICYHRFRMSTLNGNSVWRIYVGQFDRKIQDPKLKSYRVQSNGMLEFKEANPLLFYPLEIGRRWRHGTRKLYSWNHTLETITRAHKALYLCDVTTLLGNSPNTKLCHWLLSIWLTQTPTLCSKFKTKSTFKLVTYDWPFQDGRSVVVYSNYHCSSAYWLFSISSFCLDSLEH